MKKLFFLVGLITAMFVSNAQDQQGGDPAVALQRYMERVKPQLVEKTKLTEAEAEKVIKINFDYRGRMRGLRDVAADERKKQMNELQAAMDKDLLAIPLTQDQLKTVKDFFEEQRKQMQQQRQNGGGSGK
ncbi:MAG TPA: hypothetical protein VFR58_18365 [Flavisolibacter sp.]|nr:hypothetical protein [Flavisolibacter sp.]